MLHLVLGDVFLIVNVLIYILIDHTKIPVFSFPVILGSQDTFNSVNSLDKVFTISIVCNILY